MQSIDIAVNRILNGKICETDEIVNVVEARIEARICVANEASRFAKEMQKPGDSTILGNKE